MMGDHIMTERELREYAASSGGVTYLEDSGERREVSTGAVRERAVGKGRYDLITPLGLKRVALHYEAGAAKYDERNWEKGMPLSWYLDAMERHIEDIKEARIMGPPPKEDNAAAVVWNALAFMHTEMMIAAGKLPAELDDLPNPPAVAEGALPKAGTPSPPPQNPLKAGNPRLVEDFLDAGNGAKP